MMDQAAMLRAMMAERHPMPPAPNGPPTLVVGSGKGGVGKSVLSVLLAERVAADGRRVLLVDGDQNMGNLHVLLGLARANRLENVLNETAAPRDLLVPVAERIHLLPSDSGADSLYSLSAVDRARLHHRLSALYDEFDAVIVDAGPGLESVVRVATMRATRLIVVTAPEPAALTDAYATIKVLAATQGRRRIHLVVNQVRRPGEGRQVRAQLQQVVDRYVNPTLDAPVRIELLGEVPADPAVRDAVLRRQLLLDTLPGTAASLALVALAARMLE